MCSSACESATNERLVDRAERLLGVNLDVCSNCDTSDKPDTPTQLSTTRRKQIVFAQRRHRLRTQRYIAALEEEVMQLRKCQAPMEQQSHAPKGHLSDNSSSNFSVQPHFIDDSCSLAPGMSSRENAFELSTDAFDSLIATETMAITNTLPWTFLTNLGDADSQQTPFAFTEEVCHKNRMTSPSTTAYAGISPTIDYGILSEGQFFAGLLQQYTSTSMTLEGRQYSNFMV